MFEVLVTVAIKGAVIPSSAIPDGGETLTVIVGGGGGGGGGPGLAPPPPQPSVHAPAVRSAHENSPMNVALLVLLTRMH